MLINVRKLFFIVLLISFFLISSYSFLLSFHFGILRYLIIEIFLYYTENSLLNKNWIKYSDSTVYKSNFLWNSYIKSIFVCRSVFCSAEHWTITPQNWIQLPESESWIYMKYWFNRLKLFSKGFSIQPLFTICFDKFHLFFLHQHI